MSNVFNLFPETEYTVPSGRVTWNAWNFTSDLLDWDNMPLTINSDHRSAINLKEGEVWFVKLPDYSTIMVKSSTLLKMKIVKLYEKVVELKSETMSGPVGEAYKITDVEFVEKIG